MCKYGRGHPLWLRRKCVNNKNYFRLVDPLLGSLILVGMCMLSFFALEQEDASYDWYVFRQLKTLVYFLFRYQVNLQLLLAAAHLSHCLEAIVAYYLCRRELKCSVWNTYAWCIQTCIFGYGSLGLLYARVKFMSHLSISNLKAVGC